jgi:uncharacterized protein YjbI with pentapeptide repeats
VSWSVDFATLRGGVEASAFAGADFEGAALDGADFEGADFEGAAFAGGVAASVIFVAFAMSRVLLLMP